MEEMLKIWTYKSKRIAGEVGVIVQLNGERIYYKLSSESLFCIINRRRSNRKRRKLKIGWIRTFISFTYFPSDLCKPRHYLEIDQIYFHEIFRLLERLR
jgi:hypothetical protein